MGGGVVRWCPAPLEPWVGAEGAVCQRRREAGGEAEQERQRHGGKDSHEEEDS
jgi:hypothetical protein